MDSMAYIRELAGAVQGAELERVPYEAALRTIGAYLDEQRAREVTVVELPDSFALRFRTAGAPRGVEYKVMSTDGLGMIARDLVARRRRVSRFRPEHEPGEPTYQDRLRAIGHELDGLSANSITVDEVGDRLVIGYLYLRPQVGYLLHKHMATIHVPTQQAMVRAARGRRQVHRRIRR